MEQPSSTFSPQTDVRQPADASQEAELLDDVTLTSARNALEQAPVLVAGGLDGLFSTPTGFQYGCYDNFGSFSNELCHLPLEMPENNHELRSMNSMLDRDSDQHYQHLTQQEHMATADPSQTVQEPECQDSRGETPTTAVTGPLRKRQTGRRVRLDWEPHKAMITSLYIDQNLSLQVTRERMKKDKGFEASESAYKQKIKQWKLQKNFSARHATFIEKKSDQRQHEQGKGTKPASRKRVRLEEKHMDSGLLEDGERDVSSLRLSSIDDNIPRDTRSSTSSVDMEWRAQPEPDTGASLNSILLNWQGLSANDLIQLSKDAENWANTGLLTRSLEAFDKSLDGLEAILGATHATTQHVMNTYFKIADEHQLYDQAQNRLLRSVNENLDRFGGSDTRVLSLLARLGCLLMAQEKRNEAEIVAERLIDGVERSDNLDAEDKFAWTQKPRQMLCDIANANSDFVKENAILEVWIIQAEDLGTSYVEETLELKHQASHVFLESSHVQDEEDFKHGDEVACHVVNRKSLRMAEKYLNEYIQCATSQSSWEQVDKLICSLKLLTGLYLDEKAWNKLASVCDTADHVLYTMREAVDDDSETVLELKRNLALSMIGLERFEEAETRLVQLQRELDSHQSYGPQSKSSFSNLFQRIVCSLKRNRWDVAESLVKQAQQKAKLIFSAEHTIHTRLETCLETQQLQFFCSCCMIADREEGIAASALVARSANCEAMEGVE